jgi:hypothetical protein
LISLSSTSVGSADLDDRDATGELGHTLVQLLLVEVGVGVLDLALDLGDALLDGLLGASAVDDRGVVLGDLDGLGAAEHLGGDVGLSSTPSSFMATWPPVRIAMSSSMRLRRSP